MSYESVDKLQNLLADEVFHYATDKKKAAGRALGTFIEVITYYLLKNWNVETFAAIERPLPEFANDDITHNVEFTLHGHKLVLEESYNEADFPISISSLLKKHNSFTNFTKKKTGQLIDKHRILRNACTILENENSFVNFYVNSSKEKIEAYELIKKPFAMFECKRVGVEEGTKKGPQTIEKAKQGSYVARTVSSLQKIRQNDGIIAGFIHKDNGSHIIKEYYSLLDEVIKSNDIELLNNFILTVGVVSNHGNWFTSENPNKELKVLAQSYDWLLFLTDKGISEFITELLLKPEKKYSAIKKAFDLSYNSTKTGNVFTKVKMNYDADIALNLYFKENSSKIENWFNVISPKKRKLDMLKNEIKILTKKDWWSIYS